MSDNLYNLALDLRERLRFMQEIGVDSLSVELSEQASQPAVPIIQTNLVAVLPNPSDLPVKTAVPEPTKERRAAGSRLAALPSLSSRPLPVRPKVEPVEKIDPSPRPGAAAGPI